MSVIVNTTVISNFASIGQLDLLRRLFGEICIAVHVYEEIKQGQEEGYRFYENIEKWIYPFSNDGWIRLTSLVNNDELRYLQELPARLHSGERASIAIARHRGWVLLTDDWEARKVAEGLGIPVSGSIGCLVLSVERGLCSLEEANVWLNQMIEQGYHSPITDLTPLVK